MALLRSAFSPLLLETQNKHIQSQLPLLLQLKSWVGPTHAVLQALSEQAPGFPSLSLYFAELVSGHLPWLNLPESPLQFWHQFLSILLFGKRLVD